MEYLKNFKGNTEALLTLEIMKDCVSDHFASEYSLKGKSGKSNFSDLEFYTCVLGN